MPVEGDSVVIPQGQTILLDVYLPRLYLILVRGMLIFDRKVCLVLQIPWASFFIIVLLTGPDCQRSVLLRERRSG